MVDLLATNAVLSTRSGLSTHGDQDLSNLFQFPGRFIDGTVGLVPLDFWKRLPGTDRNHCIPHRAALASLVETGDPPSAVRARFRAARETATRTISLSEWSGYTPSWGASSRTCYFYCSPRSGSVGVNTANMDNATCLMELVDRMIVQFLHARTAARASSLLRLKRIKYDGNYSDRPWKHYGLRSGLLPDLVISHI